jgi:hypothetical protein
MMATAISSIYHSRRADSACADTLNAGITRGRELGERDFFALVIAPSMQRVDFLS